MANFRVERLFIRIDGSIDGFDPSGGIDVAEFAYLSARDLGTVERLPLREFSAPPFGKPRWFPAQKGLKVVHRFIGELEAKLAKTASDDGEGRVRIERDIATLRTVEDRLDIIDTHELRFYFLERDLPADNEKRQGEQENS